MRNKFLLLALPFIAMANVFALTEENTGWSYEQTTLQTFYIFPASSLTINGQPIEEEDVIGTFTEDGYCVGWIYAVTDGNGYVTPLALGAEDGATENYLQNGEVPVFRVFDFSESNGTTAQTQDSVLPVNFNGIWLDGSSNDETDGGFENNAIYLLNDGGSLVSAHSHGCYDETSCEYSNHWISAVDSDSDGDYDYFPVSGGVLTTDDATCWSPNPGCACSNEPGADVDDCGVCEGNNADMDCTGTCFGQAELDCAGVCEGTSVEDCAGDCDGSSVIDECGECGGSGASITCWNGSLVCEIEDCPEQLDNEGSLPASFEIFNIYPNPFNPSTMISFSLSKAENINITVLNSIGNEIELLFDGLKGAGYHQLSWTPSLDVSTGSYLLKVSTPGNAIIRKVSYIK